MRSFCEGSNVPLKIKVEDILDPPIISSAKGTAAFRRRGNWRNPPFFPV